LGLPFLGAIIAPLKILMLRLTPTTRPSVKFSERVAQMARIPKMSKYRSKAVLKPLLSRIIL
jgi:hypothetical protein